MTILWVYTLEFLMINRAIRLWILYIIKMLVIVFVKSCSVEFEDEVLFVKKGSKGLLMCMLITGICAGSAQGVFAEEKIGEFNLDQMVVTASRLEESNFEANANVNVVTRKDIEEKHYQTVSDALRAVPGVAIQNYSATGANYSADYLYVNGTSHVLVLVDGQRANTNGSVSSVFQPSEVSNMDNIERIEVLKGSASTLYGSDAVGGVINIITRKPKAGGTTTKISGAWGSYGKKTYNVYNEGMTKGGFYWTVNGQTDKMSNYKDGHGNSTPNKIDSKSYGVKLGQKFDDKADINVSYSRYKLDYGRPETGSSMMGPTIFTGGMTEGKKDNTKYTVAFDYKFNDKLSNRLTYFSRTSDLDDDTRNPVTLWLMREKTWGFSEELTYANGNHTIVGGYDYYKDAMNKYHDQYTPNMTGTVDNKAFFIQDQMQFGAWGFTPGVRFSKHSEYGNKTTGSGVLSYKFNDLTNMYVSYKEFFRAPYMYELYNPFYGSEKLNPEEGETKEIGLNTRIDDKTTFSAHYFRTDSDNLIGFNNVTWKYYNAGAETIKGWDVQLTKAFDDHFSATAAYTHTYIPATSAAVNPNRNGYIPKGQYDLTFNYDDTKFNGSLNIKGIVDRPGSKSNEAQVLDTYKSIWTANLALNYKPVKGMNVFFKLNNIFDRMYTDMTYDMRNPGGDGWYSQPGRNFVAGVEYTF